jgi:hypothetical protein
MYTGVITMISVITSWPTTIDATASCTVWSAKIVRAVRAAVTLPAAS